jgi:hypothetical protein
VIPIEIVALSLGSGPNAVTAGNFVAGGGIDLAVSCNGSNTIDIIANTGAGFALATSHPIAGHFSPSAIASGNVDASGLDDVAFSCEGSFPTGAGAGIGVILNNAAPAFLAGSFRRPQDIGVGDLNDDGFLDIAAVETATTLSASTSDNVLLYQGDGLGGFTPAGAGLHLDTPPGAAEPHSISIGDMDADGLANDITIACDPTLGVDGKTVVFANQELGGTLDQSLFVTSAIHTAGLAPRDVAAVDLQRDSIFTQLFCGDDAVVVNFGNTGANDMTIFQHFDCATNQFAGSTVSCEFANVPVAVATGDLNGDTLPDIVVVSTGGSYVTVFLSNIRALATPFGMGCTGTAGVPQISGPMLAIHGETARVSLSSARPMAACILGVSTGISPTVLPPSGCTIYLSAPVLTFSFLTDGAGEFDFDFLIPAAPLFTGAELYFQWAIFDPMGDYLGILAFSDALRVRVGF